MPAKPLSKEQLEDAKRLRERFDAAQQRNPALTQETLAIDCGWKTQGTVNQYLKGKIPLNLEAAFKFSVELQVWIEDISPSLAKKLAEMAVKIGPKTSPKYEPTVSAAPSDLARLIQAFGGVDQESQQRILDFAEAEVAEKSDSSTSTKKKKRSERV